MSNTECQTDQKGGTYSNPYHNKQTLKSYTYYAGLYEQFNKLMQNIIN